MIKPTTEFARLIIHITKAMRFARLCKPTYMYLDAVTERSTTPSFLINYLKSICVCEKIFVSKFRCLQFLLTPACIDINTEPLVDQNETM